MKLESLGKAHLQDLLPLVKEYHAFEGIDMSDAARSAAVEALLADDRLGAVWAIVEDRERIGYIALTYGYSIEFRGRDAFVDEFYIRAPRRGRGIGTRVLEDIKRRAIRSGIRALHLEVDRHNHAARSVYTRIGFEARDRFSLISVKL